MPEYVFPTALAMRQVAAENAARLMAGRVIFDIMPIVHTNDDILAWEQRDNFTGLQGIRGLNGEPTRVKHTGGKRYLAEPGYYGEYEMIDERELTRRRGWGDFAAAAVDATDLVLDRQEKLQSREFDRQEQVGWASIQGTYSVADGTSVLATDTWSPQTFSAAVAWGTVATATPLADLRAVQLKGRGFSVDFGTRARAYMNRTTMNAMLGNTNAADLGGQKATSFSPLVGEGELNQRLAAAGLPGVVPYDQGYIDDSAVFQLFIPNNKVYVIGARLDGDPIMEYRITRNATLDGRGDSYSLAVESREPPKTIAVHRGHNGGPVILHPAAIVVMTV
jgi:hypothetical protein